MNTETNETTSPAQAFADSCGLTFKAEFVPFSKSRNAKEKNPSVNWKVTISKGNASLVTDYMQGAGHLKGYKQSFGRETVAERNAYMQACETGRGSLGFDKAALKAVPPTLVDVLYSLVMDSDVLNYSSFEEWTESCGYDTDSRSAEKIYQACMATALQLRQMIDLTAAAEAFQDY